MYKDIQEYLTYEQRKELIRDICSVYEYTYGGKQKLHKMSDDNLFAFRESLRERGKISRFLSGSYSCHVSVIMKKIGSDTYTITTKWIDQKLYTYFHLGVKSKKLDKIGIISKTIEIGYIKLDQDYKIIKVEIYGNIVKRFNGLELIIDGPKK